MKVQQLMRHNTATRRTYCHVLGVCVTNKTGFGFDHRIYWTFIQMVTTVHRSLPDILSSSSDWRLHGNYSHFQLNSVVLFVLRCTLSYSSLLLQFKVKVELRLTVSQSVSPGVQIFITVWQSRSCLCGAPSLTRGRVFILSESLSALKNHLS
jgi:hypothetical protein